MMAPDYMAWHLSGKANPPKACALFKAGIASLEAGGAKGRVMGKAVLAECMALAGDLDNALHLIDEQYRTGRTPRLGGTPSLR